MLKFIKDKNKEREVILMMINNSSKEKNDSKKEFTIETLFNAMVETYMGQVKRENFCNGNTSLQIYRLVISTIEKKIKEEPEKADYYNKMYEVAQKFFDLMNDPRVRDDIIKSNMKTPEFIKLYKEEILGKYKRQYDMSGLFRETYIKKADNTSQREMGKKLEYVPNSYKRCCYKDKKGNKVTIEPIGKLYIKYWNGLETHVFKYRIQKQLQGNKYLIDEVYSNISIFDMDDPEYREAVLQELLSDNNISLSNSGGYIGEISETPEQLKGNNANGEDEKMVVGSYFYKINDRYSLKYDPEDLSSVMIYEKERAKEMQERKNREQQKEDEGER